MRITELGHKYELDHLESDGHETLTFIRRSSGAIDYGDGEHPGTNSQEVLRALIDRTKYLNDVLPCDETSDAIYHLRMALYLYEVRAHRRKIEKLNRLEGGHEPDRKPNVHRDGYRDVPFSEHEIEDLPVGSDGHVISFIAGEQSTLLTPFNIVHKMWTRAAYKPHYNKGPWKVLEAIVNREDPEVSARILELWGAGNENDLIDYFADLVAGGY